MTDIVDRYLETLMDVCRERGETSLEHTSGASAEDLRVLRETYPDVPLNLLRLLERMDGTYYRQYGEHEVCQLVFGFQENWYYLLSAQEMAQGYSHTPFSPASDCLGLGAHMPPDPEAYAEAVRDVVAQGIDPWQPLGHMLHFTNCYNNGGSSKLYVDFHPGEGGIKGQIVRWTHDEDHYDIVAPSFDAFLEECLQSDFAFIEDPRESSEDMLPRSPEVQAALDLAERAKVAPPAPDEALRVSLNLLRRQLETQDLSGLGGWLRRKLIAMGMKKTLRDIAKHPQLSADPSLPPLVNSLIQDLQNWKKK